jgi:site-specific recombinase XerC
VRIVGSQLTVVQMAISEPSPNSRPTNVLYRFCRLNSWIGTKQTRRAYYRAAEEFLAWCASAGVPSIPVVQPVHVATWIEASTRELAAPSVKQRLAPLRHLFDWLVNGQVVPVNPAHTVSRLTTRS